MSLRVLLIVSSLLLITACSTTSGMNKSSDGAASSDVAERYRIASGDLEPFTPIKGSKVGARASDRVFFDFDSSVLSSAAQKTLDKQAKWLKGHSNVDVTVEGHCDERGTREYNLALGDRRANAVKSYLVSSGVGSNRISVISYGKERPAVSGSNYDAWAENRRGVTVLK